MLSKGRTVIGRLARVLPVSKLTLSVVDAKGL